MCVCAARGWIPKQINEIIRNTLYNSRNSLYSCFFIVTIGVEALEDISLLTTTKKMVKHQKILYIKYNFAHGHVRFFNMTHEIYFLHVQIVTDLNLTCFYLFVFSPVTISPSFCPVSFSSPWWRRHETRWEGERCRHVVADTEERDSLDLSGSLMSHLCPRGPDLCPSVWKIACEK